METRIREIIESDLEEVSILSLLDEDERRLIADLFELVSYPAGTVCVREGDRTNFIGIIASGKLEVKRHTELESKHIPIAVLSKGSHIGDFSMLSHRPAFGTVTALEDTKLLVIGRDKLDAFIREHPTVGVKVLKGIAGVLAIRLERAIEKVARLS